ncbi:MAG TPA: hypothetical protein VGK67_09790 [Myxococcales bacterium]|jgi:hypothetical protein
MTASTGTGSRKKQFGSAFRLQNALLAWKAAGAASQASREAARA